jgi:hypothetical protein
MEDIVDETEPHSGKGRIDFCFPSLRSGVEDQDATYTPNDSVWSVAVLQRSLCLENFPPFVFIGRTSRKELLATAGYLRNHAESSLCNQPC